MLFRSKNIKPGQAFPNSYIDIHSHVLPGIDDGAQNIEDSITLIRSMEELGVKKMITTPHIYGSIYPNTKEIILEKLEEVRRAIEVEGIDVELSAAAEYMMDDYFLKLLEEDTLLTLKDKYLLVEMSYIQAPSNLYEILFDLQMKDYIPILAHPERYAFLHRNFSEYEKLKDHGCLFQMNILSLSSHYGKRVQKTACKLIKKGMIDFMGSDLHHSGHLKLMNSLLRSKRWRVLEGLVERNGEIFG